MGRAQCGRTAGGGSARCCSALLTRRTAAWRTEWSPPYTPVQHHPRPQQKQQHVPTLADAFPGPPIRGQRSWRNHEVDSDRLCWWSGKHLSCVCVAHHQNSLITSCRLVAQHKLLPLEGGQIISKTETIMTPTDFCCNLTETNATVTTSETVMTPKCILRSSNRKQHRHLR